MIESDEKEFPLLPVVERAVVEIEKLRDYSLNPWHPVGKHKARVFQSALGITAEDAEWLRDRILAEVANFEAIEGPPSLFGMKYVVDMEITRGANRATIRTSWIIEYGRDFPRLTSCYVL